LSFAGLAVALCVALGIDDSGRLILRPHVAAVDRQQTLGIDADEDTGTGDVYRFVDERPGFEDGPCRFDLAKTLIDFVRQFVSVLVVRLDLGILGVEGVKRRPLFLRQISRLAVKLTQAVGVAVWEINRHCDPLPTLGGDRLSLSL
jgi:hypothetical protein